MGYSSYSFSAREDRAATLGFFTKSVDQIFEQNTKREIHESMNPKNAKLRESRDSATHPNSIPIILGLDVTGSMGTIPHYLVKDGLPKTISGIIQAGIPDPQLLFLAVGDTECDRYPLQVGQFESGDEELDTWLTRTYIERGGGGNAGESYLLAWYFAAMHTATDAWDKRKQKGFLFTTGDEPCLKNLPKNVISMLMGETVQAGYSDRDLLALAQEKWNVYHLHVMQGSRGESSLGYWQELLGQNCIRIDNYENISNVISETVTAHTPKTGSTTTTPSTGTAPAKEEILL